MGRVIESAGELIEKIQDLLRQTTRELQADADQYEAAGQKNEAYGFDKAITKLRRIGIHILDEYTNGKEPE